MNQMTTRSMTAAALASRADHAASDYLPDDGECTLFFAYDGMVTRYTDRHGHESEAGDDVEIKLIGLLVNEYPDAPLLEGSVLDRDEAIDRFGLTFVTGAERAEWERVVW